ncbi:MAG: TonB-dependent receptor family protein [Burkholderiaceae bacterium]|jgi:Fe(3+) dicitrate transport protein
MTFFRKTVMTSAVAMALSSGAHAQQAETRTLPPVEVKGSSILPGSLETLPGSSFVLSRDDLQARNPFSIIETIREIPGLHVVGEDVAGTHLNIGLRGLNPRRSSRTLLLEDGAPTIFFAPYGDPSAHYSTPLDRVDRIEVLKGSGQILYGPQTMGGMINFVTRPVPTDGTRGSIKISGGNRGYYDGHFSVGSGTENGGLMIDVLKKQGDGIRREHGFDLQDVALKGMYKISSNQRITGKYSNFQEDSRFSETGLTAAEYRANPLGAGGTLADLRQERFTMKRDMAQLIHELDLNEKTKLSTQLYYTNTNRESRRIREIEEDGGAYVLATGGDAYAIRPRSYKTYGIEPKLQMRHSNFGVENETVVGFRYHEERIDRKKYIFSNGTFADPAEEDERLKLNIKAMAAYAQNTFLAGDWAVTPGVRFERISYDKKLYSPDVGVASFSEIDSTLKHSKSLVLPGLGVAWNGLSSTTVFAGIHKGFAPPRPDRDINGSTIVATRPETSITSEIGIRSSALKSGSVEATLFNMDISDLVVQSGGIFRNAGRAQHTGIELAGRLNSGELLFDQRNNVFVSVSYTNLFTAKFKDSGTVAGEGEDGYGTYAAGNRLPYAPKHMLTLNLSYERPDGWRGRIGLTHLSRQFGNAQNYVGTSPEGYQGIVDLGGGNTATQTAQGLFGEIPALTLANASLSYSPVGEKTTWFATVENLTDKRYFNARTNGLQPGRPRMVFVGVRYSF